VRHEGHLGGSVGADKQGHADNWDRTQRGKVTSELGPEDEGATGTE
jgi:hypothetical protein